MLNLIIFILVSYGITNIMIYGSIFEWFRDLIGVNKENPWFLGKLFGCFMCLSFWIGVILSNIMYSPTLSTELLSDLFIFGKEVSKEYVSMFLDGCLASATVWLIHTVQERIEE